MARRPNWFFLRLFNRCWDLLLGFVVVVAFILLPSVRILASVAVVVVLVAALLALVVSVMLVALVALVVSVVLVALIVLCVCVV